jgi:uncharacterized protein YdaU (DUF1376 family)
MSFQYMPLYTGDYLRDTRFLTPLKHGIYLLALVHCWDSKGPMPLDEQECAGICNCRSADEVEALRYILERFFVRNDYGYFNVRMQKEIERSEAISGARSVAGKAGYQAKAKQLLGKSLASATTISPSLSPYKEKTKRTATAMRLPPDFVPSLEVAISFGIADPKRESEAFIDYWTAKAGRDATKLDWLATWRNWCRNSKNAKRTASEKQEVFV